MDEPLHCLVENPKGSREKHGWDEVLGGVELDRLLLSSVAGMTDDKGQDDEILRVPQHDPDWSGLRNAAAPPGRLRTEIRRFFSTSTQPEGTEVTVDGWCEREVAIQAIEESRARWQEARC